MSGRDLVVGVDVGSQGTCAQAIDADGLLVTSSYVPHELSYPRPGWAEQDPRSWLGAVAQALGEVRRATAGSPLARQATNDPGSRNQRAAACWSGRCCASQAILAAT